MARGKPIVVLDQPILPGAPTISLDDEGGMYAAMQHLLGLGHRRIGVVTFCIVADVRHGPAGPRRQDASNYPVTAKRLAGAAAAVRAAGLSWEKVPVVETLHNDPASGAGAAAQFLARRNPPTAILAFSDQLAVGVLHAARAAGLSVPRDLSVTGFDDTPAATFAEPPLTTVHQPLLQRGEAVGHLVRTLLANHEPLEPHLPATFPTNLVIRGSTAPPRADAR